jgi:hypothetical protein
MSSRIYPDGADPATYRGLPSVYEYVNGDGELRKFNCGQAVACSLLTQLQVFPQDPDAATAHDLMLWVEEEHPPDNVGGWLGTSRRRVERICRTNGIEPIEVDGEEELRTSIAAGKPVMVMVGTEGPRVWKWTVPAGHWMLAYGYDDRQLFLTNWSAPGMNWDEFRYWWDGIVPRVIGMRNVGLTA